MFEDIGSVLLFFVLMFATCGLYGVGIWAHLQEKRDSKKKRKHVR
jgi:hypothetical protein